MMDRIPSGFRGPDGVRIYVLSDIHGRADLLRDKLKDANVHLAGNPVERHVLVFLGDYIDRGPDSRGVIETLIQVGEACDCVFLRGNHETLLEGFLKDPSMLAGWCTNGARETLASYGVSVPAELSLEAMVEAAREFGAIIPDSHRAFFEGLRYSASAGDLFFVHAGVRPGVPLEAQAPRDMMWIRHDFLDHEGSFGKWIVHGHTPRPEPEIRPNRINIDTKAWASGRLTCLWLEGERFGFV